MKNIFWQNSLTKALIYLNTVKTHKNITSNTSYLSVLVPVAMYRDQPREPVPDLYQNYKSELY